MCADGAPSRLAIKLGLVTQPPHGSCSRAYVEGGTHKFTADGVVVYHKDMLPGEQALCTPKLLWFSMKLNVL